MRLLLISISMLIAPLAANAADFEKTYYIKWKEQDGKIIYSTVCYDYKKGSIDFRNCRKQAQQFFKKTCAETGEDKICAAARDFKPVI